jgi:hypothetical protein
MKLLPALFALLIGLAGGFFLSPSASDSALSESNQLLSAAERGAAATSEASKPSVRSSDEAITVEWLEEVDGMDQFDQIGALHARLKNFKVADFPSLMDQIDDNQNTVLSWQMRSMIAARWAQLDPQGMLTYANAQSGSMSWSLYNTVFSEWAKQDVQAAYQAAQQLDTRRAQQSAMQAVINAVAIDQPARAVEMAKQHYGSELGNQGRWLVQSIFRNWSKLDGEAARNSALSMPDGTAKSAALAGSLSDWMADSPLDALAWLDSLPIDSSVYGSRKEVYREFLNRDFDVAREYIESVEDPVERREIMESLQFNNLVWQKSFEEIEGIFDWMGTVAKGQVYDNRVSSIISSMAESDPDRAIDFVLNMRPGNARMNGLNAIGSKLAEVDPARAFAFIDSLAYEDEKRRALGGMGWRLSQQGVEMSSRLVAAHTDPIVQQQLAARISGEWSNYDIPGALAFSEALTDDQARISSQRAVINNWMESDATAALFYIENSIEPDVQVSVLRDAYSSWARNDPAAAAAALDLLPESIDDKRGDVYRGVAGPYIQHDSLEASEWISTLDKGIERDQSVEILVNKISKNDPEAGFIWAATVGDENRRKNTLRTSVQEWIKVDPQAAFDAITDAKIDAAEKEPLFKMLEGKLE